MHRLLKWFGEFQPGPLTYKADVVKGLSGQAEAAKDSLQLVKPVFVEGKVPETSWQQQTFQVFVSGTKIVELCRNIL